VPSIVGAVASGRPVRLEPRRIGESRPEGFATTPCFVDDAAEIAVSLLDSSAVGVLNLAGAERVSVRRIAELAGELLGREPRFRIEETPRAGDLVADTTALRKAVECAFTPFAEGLRRVLAAGPDSGAGGRREG
jgi:nucleoside-diphosphate-sugar epimerase